MAQFVLGLKTGRRFHMIVSKNLYDTIKGSVDFYGNDTLIIMENLKMAKRNLYLNPILDTVKISGWVVDKKTGEPLKNFRVISNNDFRRKDNKVITLDNVTVMTDSNGYFEFIKVTAYPNSFEHKVHFRFSPNDAWGYDKYYSTNIEVNIKKDINIGRVLITPKP